MNEANSLALREASQQMIERPDDFGRMTAVSVVNHVRLIQEVMRDVMKKDTHYGIIPGCDKPSLWKPGAEVLCVTFRIAPTYQVEDLSTDDVARYRVRCTGKHQASGVVIAEGLGACSSMEEKYKWRKSSKKEFENTSPERRRVKYGYNRSERREFEILQVRTEAADLDNTILKMAAKRAQVAMAINAAGASDIFAQDLEDLPEEYLDGQREAEGEQKPPIQQPRAKDDTKAAEKPAKKPAPENTGPIQDGMRRVIIAKLKAATLSEADMFKKFGVESWDGLKAHQANDILDWIKSPS